MSHTIRIATEADFPRIVAIINSQVTEPTTLADYIRQEGARPKTDPFYRVVAETDAGEVAGFGLVIHESHNRPGEWFIRVRVDAPYQAQGIGSALYAHLVPVAREQGATRFESSVREQDTEAYAWAEHLGFATEKHLFESTLDLSRWDPTPFGKSVTEAKAKGYRFATLAELTEGWEPEEIYRRFHVFFVPIITDIPGNEDRPSIPFDEWYGWIKDDPEWKLEQILIAVAPPHEGEAWAAMAHLYRVASGALYNDFTGVAREFRGRGLTLPLKVEALNLAQSLGAPYIRTNNLSVNPRILAVNRRLGYEPAPGHYLLAKSLA